MVAKFHHQHPSNDAFAARRADEAGASAARASDAKVRRVLNPRVIKSRRYPGRNRVMARQDAIHARELQDQAQFSDRAERDPCERPYMVEAIGLPSGHDAMRRYWRGRDQGPVPVEFRSRCRKCSPCLRHKQRLWTARAIDELKASSRTWFGTLTFRPTDRFRMECKAAIASKRAGHGEWGSLDLQTRFQWTSKAAGCEVTDWFKRVRAMTGAPLRYLLVVEPHEDGFPHFHLLLHEQDKPVVKTLLESQWRAGFSHWRLVKKEDERVVYYACKYLTKSHQTRIRASRRYGQEHLVLRVTERSAKAVDTATRLCRITKLPVSGGPKGEEKRSDPLGSDDVQKKEVSANVSQCSQGTAGSSGSSCSSEYPASL